MPYCGTLFSGKSVFSLQDTVSFFLSVCCLYSALSTQIPFFVALSIYLSITLSASVSVSVYFATHLEQDSLCRGAEYSMPVNPGGMWEIKRHVRSLVGLFLKDPSQLCGWSPQRQSKHSPRSRPQVRSHGRQGWLSLQSDRQAQIKRSIHRVDWLARKCNSVCVFHGKMAKNTDSCMHRRGEREKEVTNRQCTICDHCLSCQIALLLAGDYLCYRTTWWAFSLENIREKKTWSKWRPSLLATCDKLAKLGDS